MTHYTSLSPECLSHARLCNTLGDTTVNEGLDHALMEVTG